LLTPPLTTGLTVRANLDPLPHRIKLTDQQKKSITHHATDFHGDWNYTIQRSHE
jgi:hypothetical protein